MGWFGKSKGGADAKAAVPAVAPDASGAIAPEPATAREVDTAWYRWLAAAPPPRASTQIELRILDELARLAQAPVAGAALVPRVPEIIPQLMRTLQSEDMSAAELSRQLSQDTLLVAEVYREANRPAYLPRYHSGPPVDTIQGAIMLLGQNGMRMLLARVAFRPVVSMQSGRLARRVAPLVWRQSEKGALAASLLAPSFRANAFDAYLAGLMENVGLVVAFRVVDQASADALPWSEHFIAGLFQHARILSARIASLWEFPPAVAAAIETAGQEDAGPLAEALALGGRLARLRMLADARQFPHDDPFIVDGMSEAALAVFDKLRDEE
jgi:HD-like signal output (HDOD) protein